MRKMEKKNESWHDILVDWVRFDLAFMLYDRLAAGIEHGSRFCASRTFPLHDHKHPHKFRRIESDKRIL